MRKAIRYIFGMGGMLVLMLSCKAQKDEISYMQNIDKTTMEFARQNISVKLQPKDELVITAYGNDADLMKPFNQNYSSSEIVRTSPMIANIPNGGQNTQLGTMYIIDDEGNIKYPLIGEIKVSSLTTNEVKNVLEQKMKKYIKKPLVEVRLRSFRVAVMGEVANPSNYMIQSGQKISILDALAMAGDITIYGKRDNILVLRDENGNITKHRLDLTDAESINSPYFYLQQNDVVYVTPNKTRRNSSKFGSQTGVYVTIGSVVISTLITILTLFIRK